MIPISDDNPTLRTPVMTYAIAAITLAVWLFIQRGGADAMRLAMTVCDYGLVPGEITHRAALGTSVPIGQNLACVVDNASINYLTPITSMFLHGSWSHILGNLLFFWVFGNNIEDSMGKGRFLAFYLICGVAAAATHVLLDPGSPVPTVGASGAISGIMGAYLVLYPRVRVKMLLPIIIIPFFFRVPAWLVLIWWFFVQVVTGLPQLMQLRPEISGGVAVWAHVGGFLAGVLLIRLFGSNEMVRRRTLVSDAKGVWGNAG